MLCLFVVIQCKVHAAILYGIKIDKPMIQAIAIKEFLTSDRNRRTFLRTARLPSKSRVRLHVQIQSAASHVILCEVLVEIEQTCKDKQYFSLLYLCLAIFDACEGVSQKNTSNGKAAGI